MSSFSFAIAGYLIFFFLVIAGLDPAIYLTASSLPVSLWIPGSQPEDDLENKQPGDDNKKHSPGMTKKRLPMNDLKNKLPENDINFKAPRYSQIPS